MAVLAWPASGAAASPDRYIVVLKEGADSNAVAKEHGRRYGASVRFVYGAALDGYAAEIPAGRLGELRSDPRVAYVEPDREVTALTTQSNATWGLDRSISGPAAEHHVQLHQHRLRRHRLRHRHGHPLRSLRLRGPRVSGYDSVDGGTADDCNGHGTHVAGTMGAPPTASPRACPWWRSGCWTAAAAALLGRDRGHRLGDWRPRCWRPGSGEHELGRRSEQLARHGCEELDRRRRQLRGGGRKRQPWRSRAGRLQVLAGARHRGDDHRRHRQDRQEGLLVELRQLRRLVRPGVAITSAWYTGNTATNTISGTSMATPHTAGVAALYLEVNPAATPQQVRDALYANTTEGVVRRRRRRATTCSLRTTRRFEL